MITATELTVAARMNGMSYGKFVHALKCGLMTLPPLEEIGAQMVGEKKHARVRPVVQYSLKGEYIATYENATKAAEALEKGENGSADYRYCPACAFGREMRVKGGVRRGAYSIT